MRSKRRMDGFRIEITLRGMQSRGWGSWPPIGTTPTTTETKPRCWRLPSSWALQPAPCWAMAARKASNWRSRRRSNRGQILISPHRDRAAHPALFTGGMGSGLLGTTTTTTAATATTAAATTTTLGGVTLATSAGGLTAAGAALNAGFAGLASSASVSLINNGGDIGKTLRELGSKDSLKNLLVSMATAGALNGLSNTLTLGGQTLANITPQTANFGANLAKAAINNVASATINSALTGASLVLAEKSS